MKLKEGMNNELLAIFGGTRYGEVYSKLANDRIIFLSEDVSLETSSSFSALLLFYDNENEEEDITVYINTNGGDAAALANMYDIMQMIKAPIKTICIGKAYSAGAFLLAAGSKGKRYITKNARVMIHGIQCGFPLFNKMESEKYFKFLEEENKYILEILAKHTGHPISKIIEDCSRDLFLDANDALKYGIVDRII